MLVLARSPLVLEPMALQWLTVDKDQPLGSEVDLPVEPTQPSSQDVGAVLLAGMGRLFLRVIPWRAKKRWIVPRPNQ